MPLSIEVIDLGLTVEQALDLGLAGEPFAEDRTLGYDLVATLNDVELEYFEERRIRFEINSIPVEDRIAYVEQLLEENDARPKYVPPEDVLEEQIEKDYENEIATRVDDVIEDLLDKDAIVTLVMDEMRDDIALGSDAGEDPEKFIRKYFEDHPLVTWRNVVDRTHRDRTDEKSSEIEKMIGEEIVTRVTGEETH
jgi:hypothetical protein